MIEPDDDAGPRLRLSRRAILQVLAAQYGVLMLLVALWAWWRQAALGPQLRFSVSALVLGVGAGALIPPVTFALARAFPAFDDAVRWIQDEVIRPLKMRDAPLIAVFSGVVEELFFRWMLQGELGVVLANIIFGLFHYGGRRLAVYALWTAAIGAYLSLLLALAGGNLLVPILAHGTNNFIAVILTKHQQANRCD